MSKTVVYIFFIVVVVIFNLLLLIPDSADLLFNSSNADSAVISKAHFIWSPVLSLVFLLQLYFYLWKTSTKFYLVLLLLTFLLLILSGRTMGTLVYPKGQVAVGWFSIKTDRFSACQNDFDCETQLAYETTVETLPFWRVRLKNRSINEVIFVGPFIWNEAVINLKKAFGSGEYYD